MKIPSVTDIVNGYLEQHGFDGLFYPDECSCEKGDLAPCGNIGGDCTPGHKLPCDCGEDCDFHIGVREAGGEA